MFVGVFVFTVAMSLTRCCRYYRHLVRLRSWSWYSSIGQLCTILTTFLWAFRWYSKHWRTEHRLLASFANVQVNIVQLDVARVEGVALLLDGRRPLSALRVISEISLSSHLCACCKTTNPNNTKH